MRTNVGTILRRKRWSGSTGNECRYGLSDNTVNNITSFMECIPVQLATILRNEVLFDVGAKNSFFPVNHFKSNYIVNTVILWLVGWWSLGYLSSGFFLNGTCWCLWIMTGLKSWGKPCRRRFNVAFETVWERTDEALWSRLGVEISAYLLLTKLLQNRGSRGQFCSRSSRC